MSGLTKHLPRAIDTYDFAFWTKRFQQQREIESRTTEKVKDGLVALDMKLVNGLTAGWAIKPIAEHAKIVEGGKTVVSCNGVWHM